MVSVDDVAMNSGWTITPDPWLGERLGKPAFRLSIAHGCNAEALQAHLVQPGFYELRVPCDRVDWVERLTRLGFRLVDTHLLLELPTSKAHLESPMQPIDVAIAADHSGIVDLAKRAFRYSRFHLDPQISNTVAGQIKGDWMANCCDERRGDRVLVARQADQPIGFLAALLAQESNHLVATIDLIAVDDQARGRGIGRSLVSAFMQTYRDQCSLFRVGTQVANLPALRLYQSLGFSIVRSQYLLHYHALP
jgi:dTDP-4-amino-4,6-dideoxy-D-galactose acyltransferase